MKLNNKNSRKYKLSVLFKINLFLLMLFCFTSLSAQQVADDFEGSGTISSWVSDDVNVDNNFTNPFPTGINTSATVLKYDDYGGSYGNVRFDTDIPFELIDNHTFTLKVYIPSSSITGTEANQISLKLQNKLKQQPWTTQTEIIKTIVLDQWQELSFNFETDNYINFDANSSNPTNRFDFNRVLIQVNGENNNSQVTAYIDDFSYDGELPEIPVFNQLVWSDEFNEDGEINSSLWHHQTQIPSGGSWFNGEVQHYTDRIDNSVVENDVLKIIAKKEVFTDQGVTKNYTSARLNSKFAFQYGKVEIRAKMPTGVGTWPALWMLGKNVNEDGGYFDNEGFGTVTWPACGEIDIMEHWGDNQNYVSSATHTPSSYGATINNGGQNVSTVSTDFHIYTLVWNEEKLIFSVDDVIHYIYYPQNKNANNWPFDAEQYLLLNFAVQADIDPAFAEDALEVDYVRVYQTEAESPNPIKENTLEDLKIYPNPFQDKIVIRLDKALDSNILVNIYNVNGQLLDNQSLSSENGTYYLNNLEGLEKGIYFIEVISDELNSYQSIVFK